eukprot:g5081.t1
MGGAIITGQEIDASSTKFVNLPSTVFMLVAEYLHIHEVLRCSLLAHDERSVVNSDVVWKRLHERQWQMWPNVIQKKSNKKEEVVQQHIHLVDIDASKLQLLCEMGFSLNAARQALREENDVNDAAMWILTNGSRVTNQNENIEIKDKGGGEKEKEEGGGGVNSQECIVNSFQRDKVMPTWRQQFRSDYFQQRGGVVIDIGTYSTKAGFALDAVPNIYSTKALLNNENICSEKFIDADATFVFKHDDSNQVSSVVTSVVDRITACCSSGIGPPSLCFPICPFDASARRGITDVPAVCCAYATAAFEGVLAPFVRFENSAVAALRAYDRHTGIVISIGNRVSFATAIWQGQQLWPHFEVHGDGRCISQTSTIFGSSSSQLLAIREQQSHLCSFWGGKDLTELLLRRLQERKLSVTVPFAEASRMKERGCYMRHVKSNWNPEREECLKYGLEYNAENCSAVQLYGERFQVPEAIFSPDPDLFQNEGCSRKGNWLSSPANLCERAVRAAMHSTNSKSAHLFWSGIALSGGTFNLPGIERRMMRELQPIANATNNRINILDLNVNEEHKNMRSNVTWLGAAKAMKSSGGDKGFTLTDDVRDFRFISREEWLECGGSYLFRL